MRQSDKEQNGKPLSGITDTTKNTSRQVFLFIVMTIADIYTKNEQNKVLLC